MHRLLSLICAVASAGFVAVVIAMAACGSTRQSPQPSPTPALVPTARPAPVLASVPSDIRDLETVDNVGWALDFNRGVLRSQDQGRTWETVYARAQDLARPSWGSLAAEDAATAWAAFPRAGAVDVDSTSDGGRTWRSQTLAGPPAPGRAWLRFASHELGTLEVQAAGSSGGAFYVTADGGLTWSSITPPSPCLEPTLAYRFDGELFFGSGACTPGPAILQSSTDNGKTWSLVRLPQTSPAAPLLDHDAITAPKFTSARDGFVRRAGGSGTGGGPLPYQALYLTHDGGRTWSGSVFPSSLPPMSFDGSRRTLRMVCLDPGKTGTIGVYASGDAAKTWTRVGTVPGEATQLAFASDTSGIAAGRGIWTTSDGGQTWIPAENNG